MSKAKNGRGALATGGVAAVLNEIAEASHCGVLIDEDALPIREEVRGVCDILGGS